MRDLFPGYYQPTEEEFAELWKESIFSFDTNVLLHIYRYSPKTRERLFDILQKVQKRIWITHHVGCEYHKNRPDVISQQLKAYDKIGKFLEDNLKIEKIGSLKKDLEIYKKHPLIDVKEIILTIETAIKEVVTTVKNDLQKSKEKHPELIKNDEFHEQIINVFNGRIGNNQDKLKDIYNWAEERFKYSIPPGYEDGSRKPVPDKYGDAIIWFQLINYAKYEKKPIIFVTDDDKADWWLKGDGKTISPRPELVQEMLAEAGVQFYMYSTDRFMKYAENFLKLPEQPESIEEAREIMIQDALSQSAQSVVYLNQTNPPIFFADSILEQMVQAANSAKIVTDNITNTILEQMKKAALPKSDFLNPSVRYQTQLIKKEPININNEHIVGAVSESELSVLHKEVNEEKLPDTE
ncbi:MAG: DUF4935 domain-containing protein [Nostoc sp. NMS7]|nr:DUF4935 domain-containing protein [Nostoc sp. NMS7]